ncbi:hypothetical protein P22_2770 [Propionispora sp. 2/2-37]|uniref:hypothetical protein n=1 Tax=Propionispora sp. 2/2-37 TaxID=1677858 RepID=UPI0006BB73B6|nr:hypothetical protein [Propionispora sp. 2/2-37]CUH96680.1 hypothetical protein P22_2770 [Propionispora sp. 2/2-37]
MQTIIQMMNLKASTIKNLLHTLMGYSEIARWNFSRIIMSMTGDYRWEELNDNGRELQDQLRNDYHCFISLVRFLRNDLSKSQQDMLESSAQRVLSVIKQTGFLFKMDKEDYFKNAVYEIDLQANLISAAYQVTEDYCLLIPDMQTLTDCPKIDSWEFNEITKFKIIILSTILKEIDKSNTQKAHGNIKTEILQYAKLGNIMEGIKITDHSIVYLADGTQKKSPETLPWLDLTNDYDALIASYFEMVRAHPHSQVALLTGNPRLQERAALANAIQIKPPIYKPASEPDNTPPVHVKPNVEPSSIPSEKVKSTDKKSAIKKSGATPLPKPKTIKPRISLSSAKPKEGKTTAPKPKR